MTRGASQSGFNGADLFTGGGALGQEIVEGGAQLLRRELAKASYDGRASNIEGNRRSDYGARYVIPL